MNIIFRNFLRLSLVITLILSVMSCGDSSEKKARDIIETMTLEQKAQLVIGTSRGFGRRGDTLEVEETDYTRMVDSVRRYVPGAAGVTAMFPDLGISAQVLADGPAGLRISPQREEDTTRTYYCTAFPIATLLASSWDVNLLEQIGGVMGNEVLEYGVDVLLGPGMNLQRDPLCGRNFEYYSEDPLVTGKMAAAMVRGVQSNGVGTSIKHYAVNNQETNRHSVNAVVSERALREIYLKGFEIAVKEGKPWTVMSSYNKVNGPYTSENHDLLTKILRNDWGFEGYVMTDWGGGSDVVAQMEAGNDLIMPGSPRQIEEIVTAVNEGNLEESVVDDNITRILKIMFKSPKYNNLGRTNAPDLEKHAEIAREAAANGMILLKNESETLPLSGDIKTVAAFGNTSYEFLSGGTGSGDVNEAYTISLIQGLNNAGLQTNSKLQETYETYIKEERESQAESGGPMSFFRGRRAIDEMELSPEMIEEIAADSDAAFITIGRNAGEGGDRRAEEGDFYLRQVEKDMITSVSQAFASLGKKTIVILNISGVIETASWKDIPDAILCAWQAGQEGGNSVMDVLTGKINPSGKLAVSFPLSYDDSPTSENFPGEAVESDEAENIEDVSGFSFGRRRVPWEVVYEEDIYVGYRYYSTFNKPVSYEFGYGLSYTTFGYGNIEASSESFKKDISISVEVTNTGETAGREVVQLYVASPDGKLEKPEIELKAFGKTGLLEPGSSEIITFSLGASDLASFDSESSTWLLEAGEYKLLVGASSEDIRAEAAFTVKQDIVAGTVSKALVPEQDINKLSKTR